MSTKTELGAFDALEKAEPSEPIFPLLAHDPDAPATITEWCRLRRNRAIKAYGESNRREDKALLKLELLQCQNAELVAEKMADWRSGQEEVPAAVRISHGVQRSEEELAAATARQRIADLCRHIQEARYHICEARDGFSALDQICLMTFDDMTYMMARLQGIEDARKETLSRSDAL